MKKLRNIQKKILLVDDEPFNIYGLQLILNMIGPKNISKIINTAHNGMEALNSVKAAHYNNDDEYCYGLIFMDLSMPVMDGYEASDRIREFVKRKNLPQPLIIAVTGHSHEDYIKKCWRH